MGKSHTTFNMESTHIRAILSIERARFMFQLIEQIIDRIPDESLKKVEKVSEQILDMVFPQSLYCVCCGNIIDSSRSYSICDHCMEHIRWNADDAREIDGMNVIRCVDYGIYERSIIFAFKYDNHRYIARDIAKIMRDRIKISDLCGEHIIIPVPIHPNKRAERGFNQSEIIGKYFAKEMGWHMEDALERTRETRAMRGLGSEERWRNIEGSISLKKEKIDLICNQDIMLVDDFYTTGSTARECMRALSIAKPRSVTLLAFAGREWKKVVDKS